MFSKIDDWKCYELWIVILWFHGKFLFSFLSSFCLLGVCKQRILLRRKGKDQERSHPFKKVAIAHSATQTLESSEAVTSIGALRHGRTRQGESSINMKQIAVSSCIWASRTCYLDTHCYNCMHTTNILDSNSCKQKEDLQQFVKAAFPRLEWFLAVILSYLHVLTFQDVSFYDFEPLMYLRCLHVCWHLLVIESFPWNLFSIGSLLKVWCSSHFCNSGRQTEGIAIPDQGRWRVT